jgi:hypothetical protein
MPLIWTLAALTALNITLGLWHHRALSTHRKAVEDLQQITQKIIIGTQGTRRGLNNLTEEINDLKTKITYTPYGTRQHLTSLEKTIEQLGNDLTAVEQKTDLSVKETKRRLDSYGTNNAKRLHQHDEHARRIRQLEIWKALTAQLTSTHDPRE